MKCDNKNLIFFSLSGIGARKVNFGSISEQYFLALAKHVIQELIIIFPSSMVIAIKS